jgi:hypothetical protein
MDLFIPCQPRSRKTLPKAGFLEVLFLGLPPSAGLKRPLRIDRRWRLLVLLDLGSSPTPLSAWILRALSKTMFRPMRKNSLVKSEALFGLSLYRMKNSFWWTWPESNRRPRHFSPHFIQRYITRLPGYILPNDLVCPRGSHPVSVASRSQRAAGHILLAVCLLSTKHRRGSI